jgi:hypothetical protein
MRPGRCNRIRGSFVKQRQLGQQIGVGQLRALRAASGAARVHLDADIAAYHRQIRVGGGLSVAPRGIIAVGDEDLAHARELIPDGGDGVEEFGADE